MQILCLLESECQVQVPYWAKFAGTYNFQGYFTSGYRSAFICTPFLFLSFNVYKSLVHPHEKKNCLKMQNKQQLTLKGGNLCCEGYGSLLGLQSLFLHGLKLFSHLLLYLPLLKTRSERWSSNLTSLFRRPYQSLAYTRSPLSQKLITKSPILRQNEKKTSGKVSREAKRTKSEHTT
jgi:hypothetical protein